MPYSNHEQITPIISEIKALNPESILDVGCGLGLYGFLCRIHMELYDDANFFEKLKDSGRKWNVRIDAIEGFEGYLKFIPQWAYDNVMIGDALKILSKIEDKRYDVVLALAILEHFSKEDGIVFLNELKRTGKKVIISVPKEWSEQSVPDNPYETHRSHWTDSDLTALGFNKFLPHRGVWIAVYNPDMREVRHEDRQDVLAEEAFKRVENSIKTLNDKVNLILNSQNVILDRLSLSLRVKSILKKLFKPF